jgi:low temperature requirement protein LtrA
VSSQVSPSRTRPVVLRTRSEDDAPRVTNLELFFDLVYVFAITQLADFLFGDLTLRRALEALILFTAVWWAWNYTAWATNWIDPDRPLVALLLVVLMAISLVMSAAIPDAFGSRGAPFAVAYVALQVVRSAFMVWAFPAGDRMRRNYAQLLAWSAIAGVVWIAGAFVSPDARIVVWLIAIVLDLGAPIHGFRLPGVASTPITDWTLAGAHLAERCQLVLMIALGESVLRVGLTFSDQRGGLAVDAAFVCGFIASASLWGTYFLRHAERGAEAISASSADAARVGRSAYAYAHAIMVAGVIVVAVAIRLTIDDPTGPVTIADAAVMLGGPALYLAGLVLFKHSVKRGAIGPPAAGIAAMGALVLVALFADRLALCAAATAVLAALAVGAGLAAE